MYQQRQNTRTGMQFYDVYVRGPNNRTIWIGEISVPSRDEAREKAYREFGGDPAHLTLVEQH